MSGFINIQSNDIVRSVTFSTDTSAYASGDLVADVQEITFVGMRKGQPVRLRSIVLLDKADQKLDLNFVFLKSNTSLGTENAAPSITDDDAENIVAIVPVAVADYVDIGGAGVATKACDVILDLAAGQSSLWVGIINGTGAPTYAAASLVAQFGFSR